MRGFDLRKNFARRPDQLVARRRNELAARNGRSCSLCFVHRGAEDFNRTRGSRAI
jgi:hypothetical protein